MFTCVQVVDSEAGFAQTRHLCVKLAFDLVGVRLGLGPGQKDVSHLGGKTLIGAEKRADGGGPRNGSALGQGQVNADPQGRGMGQLRPNGVGVGAVPDDRGTGDDAFPVGAQSAARDRGVHAEPVGVDHQADERVHRPCF